MQQSIYLGAYGWRHSHWLNSFYPEDMPVDDCDDWRLTYYANEFQTVMVPSAYWCDGSVPDCEDWVDAVNDDFRFMLECDASLFDALSVEAFAEQLTIMLPKLSGLAYRSTESSVKEKLCSVIERAEFQTSSIELFELSPVLDSSGQECWLHNKKSSSLAIVDNDLTDLRAAKAITENIMAQRLDSVSESVTMIIKHENLKAENLSKFRSVLEIMGL